MTINPNDSIVSNFLIAAYNSARAELIERIKQRDQAVRIYLSVLTIAIAAAALGANQSFAIEFRYSIYVLIGLFSLALSQSVSNHQIKIATIGYFIETELVEELKKLNSSIRPIDWETSKTNKSSSRLPRQLHYIYYHLTFLSPQVLAIVFLCYLVFTAEKTVPLDILSLLFLCATMFGTFYVLNMSNRERNRYNAERKHH